MISLVSVSLFLSYFAIRVKLKRQKAIIIIVIIIFVTTFKQGIYNYIPVTTHVSRAYNVAAVLYVYIQFVLHVMLFRMLNVLYFHISTFRSVCVCVCVCVQCPVWLFSVVPRFRGFP